MRVAAISLAALVIAFGLWLAFGRQDDGITLQGSVLATDPEMVYTEGTPDISPDGVLNGCSGYGLTIGQRVYVRDTQSKTVATGSITRTFHWKDDPNLLVSRANHGCSFTYVVSDVPELDAYDISIGILVGVQDVPWDALDYNESGGKVIYLVPPITVGQ